MASSIISQAIPIKMAYATISSSKSATIALESGYDIKNTLVVGIEYKNSSGTVIDISGTIKLGQCRWTAAGTGIYFLFDTDDFNGGTAVVYYMKVPQKYNFSS